MINCIVRFCIFGEYTLNTKNGSIFIDIFSVNLNLNGSVRGFGSHAFTTPSMILFRSFVA